MAYALAGRMDIDLESEPLGEDSDGEPTSILADVWPSAEEIKETVAEAVRKEMFEKNYADVFTGDERWQAIEMPDGRPLHVARLDLRPPARRSSRTWTRSPPKPVEPIEDARVLAVLGDSVTTDHISPAGAIKKRARRAEWLQEQGVEVRDFNSYGSRRGNHEVMMRGTFANVRLRNQLVDKRGRLHPALPRAARR